MPKVKSEPATITSTVTSIFTSILLQGTLPYPVVRPSRLSSAPAEAKEGLLPSGQDARDEVEVKPARSQRTTEKKTASDKLLLVHLVLKVRSECGSGLEETPADAFGNVTIHSISHHHSGDFPLLRNEDPQPLDPVTKRRLAHYQSSNPDWTVIAQTVGKSPVRECLPSTPASCPGVIPYLHRSFFDSVL